MNWIELESQCKICTKCSLSSERTNVVIGRGCTQAPILFVGEAPGEQEDEQGIPFVGEAGKLLDILLEACMFKPDDYYITNVVKCRPPSNRVPLPAESEACIPFLRQQFLLLQPKIVVCLGVTATNLLIEKGKRIIDIHGKWFPKKDIQFITTYHPAALLRDESKKFDMWSDIKKIRIKLAEIRGEVNPFNDRI